MHQGPQTIYFLNSNVVGSLTLRHIYRFPVGLIYSTHQPPVHLPPPLHLPADPFSYHTPPPLLIPSYHHLPRGIISSGPNLSLSGQAISMDSPEEGVQEEQEQRKDRDRPSDRRGRSISLRSRHGHLSPHRHRLRLCAPRHHIQTRTDRRRDHHSDSPLNLPNTIPPKP